MAVPDVAIRFDDLYNRLMGDGDSTWDVIDGLDEPENVARFAGTWWIVSWPEHVLSPRYNGDAAYAGPMQEAEARACASVVYGEN